MRSSDRKNRVSLGKRLRKSSIACLGIRPNWDDYSEFERRQIASADEVCYPGPVYAEILAAEGKNLFPRNYYQFLGNKTAQTDLFKLLQIPQAKTRLYYGKRRFASIEQDFHYPFVAKTPVGSSRGEGVFLIGNPDQLTEYLANHNPAYIQEFLPIDRDLRVVVIGGQVVNAYWRLHREGEFRNNVSRGGRISFDDVPAEALDFAKNVASRCGFDEVGLDICFHEGKYLVIEANMAYGLEGFRIKGMDVYEILAGIFKNGL